MSIWKCSTLWVALARRASSVDKEVQLFGELSEEWMDESGPFKALYSLNKLRIPWIINNVKSSSSLVDIGCGGGLLSIPLSRKGFRVTGIDATPETEGSWSSRPTRILLNVKFENVSMEEFAKESINDASSLAKKCMAVYQTFLSGMNQRIQNQIAVNNPFVFKHVSNLKGIKHFEDIGPCVVLASPGMLQSGLSRELFERWCVDSKNGCIIAGYCVEGTLAKHILSEPVEVQAMNGERLPMRMQIGNISFSAHTDFQQTTNFVRALRPPHLILVHGESHEMNRLKAGIHRQFEDENIPIEISAGGYLQISICSDSQS